MQTLYLKHTKLSQCRRQALKENLNPHPYFSKKKLKFPKNHKVWKRRLSYLRIQEECFNLDIAFNFINCTIQRTFLKVSRSHGMLPKHAKPTHSCEFISIIIINRRISNGNRYHFSWSIRSLISSNSLLIRLPSSHDNKTKVNAQNSSKSGTTNITKSFALWDLKEK